MTNTEIERLHSQIILLKTSLIAVVAFMVFLEVKRQETSSSMGETSANIQTINQDLQAISTRYRNKSEDQETWMAFFDANPQLRRPRNFPPFRLDGSLPGYYRVPGNEYRPVPPGEAPGFSPGASPLGVSPDDLEE